MGFGRRLWTNASVGSLESEICSSLVSEDHPGYADCRGRLRYETDVQAWNAARAPDQMLEMSGNLSSRQFSELDLVERIVARLDGLHAPALKLEITESVLMDNAARTTDMLQRLKNHNIRVCIDDFGTGYSSLSY